MDDSRKYARNLKFSNRLKQIEQMVTTEYSHIWDCCCDHGFLGATLLARQAANIHFVDIVPELMAQLEHKLKRFFPHSTANWSTHCLDVSKLPLAQYEGKHLIIIAGIGGDLMIQFVDAIHQKHSHLTLDFLLCPVRQQFALRQKLINLNFSLKREKLVEDNHRFYEAILVSSFTDIYAPISPVGDKIWHSTSAEQTIVTKKYLNQILNHYQRIQQGGATNVDHIIEAYRAIRL